MPLAGSFWAALLGSEGYVRAQFEHPCPTIVVCGAIGKALGCGIRKPGIVSEDAACVRRRSARNRPVRMIEDIQGFGLQCKLKSLSKRNGLRQRHICVPKMRTVQPRVNSKRARGRILANPDEERNAVGWRRIVGITTWQSCWIDNISEGTGRKVGALPSRAWMKYANSVLQLRNGDTVQHEASVAGVVKGVVAAEQLKR